MIVDLIITAILGSINALLSLIPSWTLPTFGHDDGMAFAEYTQAMNHIVPITTILSIIGAAIALRVIMYGFDGIVWIFHQFWGSD